MFNFKKSKIKLFFKKYLFYLCHMCTHRHLQNPEGTFNALELDFWAVANCLILVLGTKLSPLEEHQALLMLNQLFRP